MFSNFNPKNNNNNTLVSYCYQIHFQTLNCAASFIFTLEPLASFVVHRSALSHPAAFIAIIVIFITAIHHTQPSQPSLPSSSSSSFITVVFLELAVAVTISSHCLPRRCFERVLNGFSLKGSENPNLHHAAIYLTVATLRAQDRNQVAVSELFWHPISLNFMQNVVNGNQNPVIAITEGCQFFLIPSSNYMELLTNTLDHENWSLVQFLMSSSYSGYDTSNLQQFLVLEFELEIHFVFEY
ncbi:hypothetical protein S245_032787 [Arachis hypogaea]